MTTTVLRRGPGGPRVTPAVFLLSRILEYLAVVIPYCSMLQARGNSLYVDFVRLLLYVFTKKSYVFSMQCSYVVLLRCPLNFDSWFLGVCLAGFPRISESLFYECEFQRAHEEYHQHLLGPCFFCSVARYVRTLEIMWFIHCMFLWSVQSLVFIL